MQAADAQVTHRNIWTVVAFGEELPEQGWKIHVSTTPALARATLAVAAALCAERKVDFKYLRSKTLLDAMNGKYAPRVSSGKFLTVYPRDDDESVYLLDALARELRGFPGPYVLNDLSWSDDSPVFTRYGAYRELTMPGTETPVPAIRDDRGRLVPDPRGVAFTVPDFVSPPQAVLARQQEVTGQVVVRSGVRATEALHLSNGGGVYRGTDASGRRVLLKEARPFTAPFGSGSDAVELLHHEFQMLSRCRAVPEVVGVHGIERLWNHWFLVEEFIEGETLAAAAADRRERLSGQSYAEWVGAVLDKVAAAVKKVHEAGVVIGDIHSRNIMLTADDAVRLIDFEASYPIDRPRPHAIGAPGFFAPDKDDVDAHAIAVLRLWLFNDLPSLAPLDPTAVARGYALAEARYPVGGPDFAQAVDFLGVEPAEHRVVDDESLRSFIAARATPDRDDLLFPGSALSTSGYRGRNVFDGAAGVLWAWRCSGVTPPAPWVDWLARRAWAVREPATPGFAGTLGTATVLDLLDHPRGRDLADYVAHERWVFTSDTFDAGRFGAIVGYLGFHLRSGGSAHGDTLARLAGSLPFPEPGSSAVTPHALLGWAGLLALDWGAVALTLAAADAEADLDVRAAAVAEMHARAVRTTEGIAVPAEGLLRLSCDLTAGSAGLLLVHASLSSGVNRLADLLVPGLVTRPIAGSVPGPSLTVAGPL
ncbi:protein kinase [Amycolatopsis sp. BJA-103]|uniref:class III lanthionine synthetase LanKC N-terminal domain-containing protein n=1 Tax=Amycolatopsis sp. BJA-103 TaxID=1911175 RepID=UPI000CA37183|nr:protein kinase [Amycolatopsis sp. BJA-103]AUI60358.1 hypothetical protein BKN51_20610 [Amycolatopsis sp. BJA-103]